MDPGLNYGRLLTFRICDIFVSIPSEVWVYTNLLQTLFPNSKRPLPPLHILVAMAYQANGGGNCSKGVVTEQQSWRAPVLLI